MTGISGAGNSRGVFESSTTIAPAAAFPSTNPDCGALAEAGAGVVVAGVSVDVDFEQPASDSRRTNAQQPMARRILLSSLIALALAAVGASAQQIWVGRGRFWRTPPKWAKHENF